MNDLRDQLIDIETVQIALDGKIHQMMRLLKNNEIKIRELERQIRIQDETTVS